MDGMSCAKIQAGVATNAQKSSNFFNRQQFGINIITTHHVYYGCYTKKYISYMKMLPGRLAKGAIPTAVPSGRQAVPNGRQVLAG
jgi:hypothetical protein